MLDAALFSDTQLMLHVPQLMPPVLRVFAEPNHESFHAIPREEQVMRVIIPGDVNLLQFTFLDPAQDVLSVHVRFSFGEHVLRYRPVDVLWDALNF